MIRCANSLSSAAPACASAVHNITRSTTSPAPTASGGPHQPPALGQKNEKPKLRTAWLTLFAEGSSRFRVSTRDLLVVVRRLKAPWFVSPLEIFPGIAGANMPETHRCPLNI